jgi:alkanesulfonate monooxygenase SsuD/methylene tetrahydromethanopterin reductase-like flavin-dependent oxidoreductase (luciferase family)
MGPFIRARDELRVQIVRAHRHLWPRERGPQRASIEEIGARIALFKSEVEARGRTFDPMSVAVTRSINVVKTPAELQKAFENRIAARRRIDRLTLRPDGKNQKRMISDEAICAGALYGTPDEIAVKLEAVRHVGAAYVLLNSAGGVASLRRFAHEVRPAFADAPTLQPA